MLTFCVEELVWSQSYYTRGAHLITRVEPILLHAWNPSYYTRGAQKRGVGAERLSPPRGAVALMRVHVYAWTRGRVDTSTAPYFYFYFFLDKSRKLFKIVSVLRSASVERFDVSRMRDFLFGGGGLLPGGLAGTQTEP